MLKIVKSAVFSRPWRICIYGPEGVGKTSFAAKFPKPLVIPCEEGVSRLLINVDCVPQPQTIEDVLVAIKAFPVDEYKTIVIDSLDALEMLIHRQILRESKAKQLELAYGGFGKGYSVATEKFRDILSQLDILREQGVQVVLIGHTITKTFQNPIGPDYTRYELALHKGGSMQGAAPAVKAWVDCLLFAHFDDAVKVSADDAGDVLSKGKGLTGTRSLWTVHMAGFDAKSPGLPARIDLDYDRFAAEVKKLQESRAKPDLSQPIKLLTSVNTMTVAQPEPKPAPENVVCVPPNVIRTTADVLALAKADKLTLKLVQAALVKMIKELKRPAPMIAESFVKPFGVDYSKDLPKDKWSQVLTRAVAEFDNHNVPFELQVPS